MIEEFRGFERVHPSGELEKQIEGRKKDGGGPRNKNLDCPHVEIGLNDMMESILNSKPAAAAVPSCLPPDQQDGDEEWLQMINWNEPGDFVVCDQGNESGDSVCDQQQGNVVDRGDYVFDQQQQGNNVVVDWNELLCF